jgi:hypothetical protein
LLSMKSAVKVTRPIMSVYTCTCHIAWPITGVTEVRSQCKESYSLDGLLEAGIRHKVGPINSGHMSPCQGGSHGMSACRTCCRCVRRYQSVWKAYSNCGTCDHGTQNLWQGVVSYLYGESYWKCGEIERLLECLYKTRYARVSTYFYAEQIF